MGTAPGKALIYLMDISNRILELKRHKNAVILAHYYQTMNIQNIADFVGDSFELARRAVETESDLIVFCGVRFMAEGAKILAPGKKVLFPVWEAGCPMADMVTPEDVIALREKHPRAAVVTYVNSTAEVKAVSDICVTSSSAERIIKSLKEDEIIFIPDRNLGAYIAEKVPDKKFIMFSGFCPVHDRVTPDDIRRAKAARPGAKVLVHPECVPEVVALADGAGSTSWILSEIENSPAEQSFIIGTEQGVLERLRETSPGREMWLARDGFVCPNMKKTTLDDVLHCLETEQPEMTLPDDLMNAARRSLERMIAVKP